MTNLIIRRVGREGGSEGRMASVSITNRCSGPPSSSHQLSTAPPMCHFLHRTDFSSFLLFQIFFRFCHRGGCVHQAKPTLFPTSGPWASGISLHICPVFNKYLSSFCQVFQVFQVSFRTIILTIFLSASPWSSWSLRTLWPTLFT